MCVCGGGGGGTHQLVTLADDSTALRVSKDDPRDAQIRQQLGSDLPSVGAHSAHPAVLSCNLVWWSEELLHLVVRAQ